MLKEGATGFGSGLGVGLGLVVGFAGLLFSNCCKTGTGLPSSGGINGESEPIIKIKSLAVIGCPFTVPIGVCPSTRGGLMRVLCAKPSAAKVSKIAARIRLEAIFDMNFPS
jgi:hypothetical protein